jgi:hypothetical protein
MFKSKDYATINSILFFLSGDFGNYKNVIIKLMSCFRGIDNRFHILLAEISKNQIVLDLIRTLLEYMQSLKRFSLSLPGKIEECARQHEIIIEAVCDRSPGRAAAAMEEHLQTVFSAVLDNYISLNNLRTAIQPDNTYVETFEKWSILFKVKEDENFNHRNILNISRIKI